MNVVVRYSNKRRKTGELRAIPGGVKITLPGNLCASEAEKMKNDLLKKHLRKTSSHQVNLTLRARDLIKKYGYDQPADIRWVSNQTTRWGSCTPSDRTIRISDRLAVFPRWVVDSVIAHELAHLRYPDHSDAFWQLANRYELAERAKGFLLAAEFGLTEAGQHVGFENDVFGSPDSSSGLLPTQNTISDLTNDSATNAENNQIQKSEHDCDISSNDDDSDLVEVSDEQSSRELRELINDRSSIFSSLYETLGEHRR